MKTTLFCIFFLFIFNITLVKAQQPVIEVKQSGSTITSLSFEPGDVLIFDVYVKESGSFDFAESSESETLHNLELRTPDISPLFELLDSNNNNNFNLTFKNTNNSDITNIVDISLDDAAPQTYYKIYSNFECGGSDFYDEIIYKNVIVKAPRMVVPGTYQVTLFDEKGFLKNGPSKESFVLDLVFTEPADGSLGLSAGNITSMGCITGSTNIDFSISGGPPNAKYELWVNGTEEATYVDTTFNTSVQYDDKLKVKVYGGSNFSNEITIDKSYFFEPTLSTTYNDSVICAGLPMEFAIYNSTCGNPVETKVLFKADTAEATFQHITPVDGAVDLSSSKIFEIIPEMDGLLKVRLRYGTEGDYVYLETNDVTVPRVLEYQEHFMTQGVRVSALGDPVNMVPLVFPGFSYETTESLDVDGTGAKEYLKKSTNEGYKFGRFEYEHRSGETNSDSIFDPTHANVTVGGGANRNTVTFKYGKYYNNSTKVCMDSSETHITVVQDDIFVPKESFCTYDDTNYDIIVNTAIGAVEVPPDHQTTSSFDKCVISRFDSPIDTVFDATVTINPHNLAIETEVIPIKIDAIAKVEISEIDPELCPPVWQPEEMPIYQVGDFVTYRNAEYECVQNAYSSDIPSRSSPKWDYIRDCEFIIKPRSVKNDGNEEDETAVNKAISDPTLTCHYPLWNSYGDPLPQFLDGDSVTHNGLIYRCNGEAYSDDEPGESSAWIQVDTCNAEGTITTVYITYASTTFYIYKPRTDGVITNLEDKYCMSNQVYNLESNYGINNIDINGGSLPLAENMAAFIPENYFTSSSNNFDTLTLALEYTDVNGCIDTTYQSTIVDKEYQVNKNVLLNLEPLYCPLRDSIEINCSHTIDEMLGQGIVNNGFLGYSPAVALGNNDEYHDVVQAVFRDNNGCRYDSTINIEINYNKVVDKSGQFAQFYDTYCEVDHNDTLVMNDPSRFAIDTIVGMGVSFANTNWIYNAKDALDSIGNNAAIHEKKDKVTLYYLDNNGCPYHKEYDVNISDTNVNATTELLFDDKYCAVDNSIAISLSHPGHQITSFSGTGFDTVDEGIPVFNPFDFYRADTTQIYNTTISENIISVSFKDDRECPYTQNYTIKTSGSFADRNDGLTLSDAYCFGNKEWELEVNEDFSIDRITGEGVFKKPAGDYFFNAYNIHGAEPAVNKDTVPLTLYYRDSEGCAYFKDYDIRLDARVVDDDSYLDIDSVYCAQDEEIGILLTNNGHTITEWSGTGLDSANGVFYYNPTDIYEGDTTLYYNNQNYYDTVKMSFLDGNKCPYQKEYIVSINGNNANKDVTLSIDDTYCFANKEYPLYSNCTIDTLIGIGVGDNEDGYYFNAFEPFQGTGVDSTVVDLSLYYRDNDGCAYKKVFDVTLDSSIVDASTELLFDDQYCAVDEDIYTQRNHNDHTLDDIWGTGVEVRGSEVYFNPFDNYRDSIELIYGDVVLDSTVTARFLDNDLCPYLKTYPIKIAGKFADQNATLNVRDEYCFANKNYNLESNYSIDSLIGAGIRKQADDYKFNAWLPYQDSAIDFKEIDFSLFYRDTSGCAYKKVFDVTLDSSIVDGSTELLFDTAYCVIDEDIHVAMNQKYHTLDEIWGTGVSVEDSAVYYNPFENFRDTTSLIYGDIVLDSLIVARFLDDDLCPYIKTYPVKIAGKYADQNATLNARDEYCFANREYTLESNYSIDSLTGIGINEESGFFTFNALPPFQDSATNFEEVDFSLYYRDNDGCAYKKVFNVTLDSSIVDATTDLDFDAYYCAVNEEKEIGRNQYDHTLEAISGQGISLIDDVVYYNPYEVFNGSADLIYSGDILQTNVSVEFLDEDLCPYIKTYTVTTSGSYGQDGVLLDFDEQFCQFDDSVKLRGTFLQIDSVEILGHNIDAVNGSFYFNPSADEFANAATDVEDVLYHYYKDNNNCMGRSLHPYTVNLKPQAGFSFEDLCVGDSTQFTDLSAIDGEGTINQWNWQFGDLDVVNVNGLPSDIIEEGMHNGQTMGTYAAPRHQYNYAGVYNASLSVTSDFGCSDIAIDTIIIGGYPVPDFKVENFVQSFPTYLQNKTKAEEFDKVEHCTWKLNDSIEDIITEGFDSLVHTFNHSGIHHVELVAITGNGCEASVTREVPIFPYIEISNENVYSAHFDNDQFGAGWINASEYLDTLISGWRLDTVFSPFSAYPNISGNLWITGDPDDNIHSENGWVESPSFDISALDFPLLSIDIYQSVEPGRDGAVIQYTLDDGQSWHLLANKENTVNQGMNWYNSLGVVSNPGDQPESPFEAWSANNYEWQTARFPLDNIRSLASDSDARSVRFRVAYASDQGNSPDAEVAGFAFDNFELTSRARIVLMEQFANTAHDANLARQEGEWLDILTQHGEAEEAVAMRYHNYIDEYYDSLYYLNTPDISSRSMEYGAYLSQLTMVDGIHRCLATSEQSAEESAKSFYQVRRLADKRFDVDVETSFENDSLIIKAEIQKLKDTLTYRPGTEKCAVRMALVQKEYPLNDSLFHNVVVELLPVGIGNVAGIIPDTLSKNGIVHVRGAWRPDNVTTIGQEYRLVVYIQGIWGVDEVHQVYFEDLDNTLIPQVDIQTLKNPEDNNETQKPVWEQQNQLMLYPIPASTDVYLKWNTLLDRELEYRITDASGRIVKEGRVADGINKTAISVESLSEGTYVLMLSDMHDTYIEKKILVVLRK